MIRYEQFSTSQKHESIEYIKHLFSNPEELANYYYKNHDNYEFCKEFDSFYNKNTEQSKKEFIRLLNKCIPTISSKMNEDWIQLYRGVEITSVSPDLDDPGICWTWDRETAEDFIYEKDEVYTKNCEDKSSAAELAPCIIYGKSNIDNVDWLMSLLLNIDEPLENEIRVFDGKKVEDLKYDVI